ncbi:MAG: hypothetical protein ACAH10_09520 [Methylophilaceae bacterium]
MSRIARILGKPDSRLSGFILSYGLSRPYSHLKHGDGSPYMRRFWLMPRWLLGEDEKGFPFPHKWVPILIRLHHIQSEDWDRDYHDHPSWYRTIIKTGWYKEKDIYGNIHLRQQGETKTATADTFHRITEISEGGVWTIFIMGRKTNEWGFLVAIDGIIRKIPWRKYQSKNTRKPEISDISSGDQP